MRADSRHFQWLRKTEYEESDLLFYAAFLHVLCFGLFRTRQQKPSGDEEMYEQTVQEAVVINGNSYFNGYYLLDRAPLGAIEGIPWPISKDGGDYCQYGNYRDQFVSTGIELKSPEINVFGISPGDSMDKARRVMQDRGFSGEETVTQFVSHPRISFYKYYLSISFGYDAEEPGRITDIFVGVYDPEADKTA